MERYCIHAFSLLFLFLWSWESNGAPGGNRVLHFPEPENVARWSRLDATTPGLHSFTICVWIKTIRTTSGPILSYGSARHPRGIEFGYSPRGHGYSVTLNGVRVVDGYHHAEAPLPADGNWHHSCVVWSSYRRVVSIYRDGMHALTRPANTSYIPGGGEWIVGNHHLAASRDRAGKQQSKIPTKSFVGFVSAVNVWDNENVDIPGLGICANSNEGSLVSWDTITKNNFRVATYKEHC